MRRGSCAWALLLAVVPAGLGCGGAVQEAPPAVVRLIPEPALGMLRPGSLGVEAVLFDGAPGAAGWLPAAPAGTWRDERGALVVEPGGGAFDLERPLALDAGRLDALEVTLASGYEVRLSLFWKRPPSSGRPAAWIERGLALVDEDGRGGRQRKTFVFDLRSHAEWTGTIGRLRLRLEPARDDQPLAVQRIRGFRQMLPPEILAERSRRPWEVEVDREVRKCLVVPPGHPAEREVTVPEAGRLDFGLGATGRLSAPVTFRISAARAGAAPEAVFESTLEPAGRAANRRWRQASVDLGAFAGERVRLRAESLAGDGFDPALGFPAWASPEIVPAGAEPSRPNVVLISIDTLRADHLSLYGYRRATSPRIDAWGRRYAATFRQAIAQAPWTLPSHCSMLTGLDPLRHGVNHPFEAAPATLTTLAERLSEAGYFTAGITGGGWLHPHYGLAGGYDRYRYWIGERRGDAELEAHAAIAGRWLEELRRPFFLFFHTYDVHDFNASHRLEPVGSEDPRAHLARHYDRAVSHMDERVGRLLEGIGAAGLRGRTVVALTSDHGEDLGEDGVFGHGSLRDQVLRVPLVLELPDGRGAGTAREEQVRSVDLVPTLLDYAGVESAGAGSAGPGSAGAGAAAELDGVSLRPLLEGGAGALPPVAASYFSLDHGLSLRFRNRFKFLYDASAWKAGGRREALFRLPGGESAERDGLAPDHPRAAPLRALARRLLEERLAGLRIGFRSGPGAPFAGVLRGDLVDAGVPKSLDLDGPWLSRAEGAAAFSLPAGRGFHLLFEHVGEPRFELEAAGAAGARAARLEIDLEALALPAGFRWTESGWRPAPDPDGAVPGVTVEWHGAAGVEGAAPFERDPELRRQLEALGYLE